MDWFNNYPQHEGSMIPIPDDGCFYVDGMLHDHLGSREGYVLVDGGVVVETGRGEAPERPACTGHIVMDVVNSHTHCADYGLTVPPGLTLEELVAPPDGLKHRHLRNASPDSLSADMHRFSSDSEGFGTDIFVDFREGGVEGCRLLRASSDSAFVMGRPVSPVFDPEEVAEILSVAHGIGLSSISDLDHGYVEAVADMARDADAPFAIHVSERIREDIDFVLSLDPAFIVHMCEATDEDLLKCAEAEVPVVVCPGSNAYFGKEPPVARMMDLGVDVAIGTDNGMLRVPDVFSEARMLSDMLFRQGGDAGDAWKTLSTLRGKLLYRLKQMNEEIPGGHVTVFPTGAVPAYGVPSLGNGRVFGRTNREKR